MTNKKVDIFCAFIFFGIAALFFPAIALENTMVNAQEELSEVEDEEMYPLSYEEEEGSYSNNEYYNDDGYEENFYDPYKDNIKKDPIVKIKKELLVCENAQTPSEFGTFACAMRITK